MRSKKGIGTIIGAVFFMFVVISALTIMSFASRQQGNFSTVTTEVNRQQMDRATSSLEITDAKIDNGKFNITLQNNGPLTERVVRLWLTNETATDWHDKYESNYLLGPKQTLIDVGQDLPVSAVNTDGYTMKLVTERGNLINFRSLSVAQANLDLSMYISPPTISTGENVTIMMSVINRERDVDSIHDLQPDLNISFTCSGADCPPTWNEVSAPNPIESLARDSTALFKWVYTVAGPPDSEVTFTGNLIGANPASSVSETVVIKPVIADEVSVTALITSGSGVVQMDFKSFQHCKPPEPGPNCTPSGAGWKPGWQVQSGPGEQYMFRVNVTNHGEKNILLDEHSAVLLLHVQEGGGGNLPADIYILKDPTDSPEDEDGDAYSPNYFKCLEVDKPVAAYFGAEDPNTSSIQSITSAGLYSVNLVFFGYIDENDNCNYDVGVDIVPYSQNLPFQGLYAT